MNVLVLQSFLAVSFQVFKLFKYFKHSPSSPVLAPCVAESFQVFKLYFFQAPSV